MDALQDNIFIILKKKLEEDIIPYLPKLVNQNKTKADLVNKQLSRAFSAFVLHKMLDIGIMDATRSVIDDFNDNGIDAIYYKSKGKTLYLLQTKFKQNQQFKEADAIRFRNGIELLLRQEYDKFNVVVQNRKNELDNAFDEADNIQLVVAYIGPGFSMHAKNNLTSLIEDPEYHEHHRLQPNIDEYGPDKVQADLFAEKSVGVVNGILELTKWQHLDGPRDTHIGVALVSDLVALHKKNEKALYERNIRYFLGTHGSNVNASIQETLHIAPDEFFYLNNGITALANLITPKGSKIKRKLHILGLSIINGAQTISSAADFVENNPRCDISKAKVLVTIIKADSDDKFGRSVTRARNHQNPVSIANFASIDPKQEELRRELSYLGYEYHYRPEAMPRSTGLSTNNITIEQAMKALALFASDSRYPYWLKNEVARFQNPESSEYQSLFKFGLTGAQLVNMVNVFRFIRDVIAANANASQGGERLFYKHGVFVVASVLAKQLIERVDNQNVTPQAFIRELLSEPLDQCRQTCWEKAKPLIGEGRSVLAYFQNQGNTVRLMDYCMATHYKLDQAPEYKEAKAVANKVERYPQEKIFRYLITKAPQI